MYSTLEQIYDQPRWQVSDLVRRPIRESVFYPRTSTEDRVDQATWETVRDRVWILHRPIWVQATEEHDAAH